MEFYLPQEYTDTGFNLFGAKERFLEHYIKLEKQRFLQSVLLEFKGQPLLTKVTFYTSDEGKDFDAELTFAPAFDVEDDTNYWESKAIENALRSAYVPELHEFCKNLTLERSQLLKEDGQMCTEGIAELLTRIEFS